MFFIVIVMGGGGGGGGSVNVSSGCPLTQIMSSDLNKQTFPYVGVAVYIFHFIAIFFMQVYDLAAMCGTPQTLTYQFITRYCR